MSDDSTKHARITHLPALDGLRGVAVIGVVLFHAEGLLRGGYLGVDLFFVLSGFLITSILLAEHEKTGRIDLRLFWVRRARRLLPAVLALMPAIGVYALTLAKPTELARLRGDAIATLAYVANWRAVLSKKAYWELFAARSPLEHMWSLAIEEQFYVVWPLLVFGVLVALRKGRRALLAVTLALLAASVAAMFALYTYEDTTRAYYGTDTRAAAILAGAALAMIMGPSPKLSESAKRWLDPLGVVAALGLAFAWARLSGESWLLYRGGFWLTEIACVVLIACAAAPGSLVARALSIKPLTLAGSISYGVYLWHWPIDCALSPARIPVGNTALLALRLAATLLVSIASYRWIEQPIRKRGLPMGRPWIVVPAAFALAALSVVVSTYARARLRPDAELAASAPPQSSGEPEVLPRPDLFQIMVLGDSTANSIGWTIRGVHDPNVAVHLMGRDGCNMLTDSCYGAKWKEYAAALRPDATLLFLGGAFMYGMHIDGEWRETCFPKITSRFEANLEARLRDLGSPSGKVWIATIPYALGDWEGERNRTKIDCINTSIRKVAKAVPTVHLLDFAAQLCPKGVCERAYNGKEIRPDGVHYSMEGAAGISRWTLEQLRR